MEELSWQTIPELVDDAARRFGDREALVDGDLTLTFVELADRAHEAARALMARGIGVGDRVGIWAPNIAEWVVAALGTYFAGAQLVPVNTRFRGQEAEYVLRKAQVRLLFTVTDFLDADYVEMLADAGGVESIDDIVVLRGAAPSGTTPFADFLADADSIDEPSRVERTRGVGSDDVCHILFTSGTTGAPKGAMLQHEHICRAYLVFADVIGLREGDRYLIVLPFFHSFGLHAGILCCLMRGATILPHLVFDPTDVMRRIADEQVTAFPGPPAIYQAILNVDPAERSDLRTLRLAILGAAAIPEELVRRMRDELGIGTVVTGYGLTEGSGICTMCRYDDEPEVVANTSGRPLPGLELRIVDDDGVEVAAGESGEIVVRGYTVMAGYLDDPEQTAAAVDSDGWLHTGDIGNVRPDGNLQITDRKKDMFTVGGFNAYPAEIEALMAAHPAIGQVAVVGVPDARLGEVGMAYVVARPGTEATEGDIIEWCRQAMANYKVPRRVEVVSELPMNASGKVLKYELRARAADAARS